jgi:hypothetical protein
MLAFAEDQLEWLRAYARRIGEWRRDTTEAGSAGQAVPLELYDGKALMDSYQCSAAVP